MPFSKYNSNICNLLHTRQTDTVFPCLSACSQMTAWSFEGAPGQKYPELSSCITALTVREAVEVANFCAAMDTLIDQDGSKDIMIVCLLTN